MFMLTLELPKNFSAAYGDTLRLEKLPVGVNTLPVSRDGVVVGRAVNFRLWRFGGAIADVELFDEADPHFEVDDGIRK